MDSSQQDIRERRASSSRAMSPRRDGFVGDGGRSSGVGAMASTVGGGTSTTTMVATQQITETINTNVVEPPTLVLSLRPRSNVTWEEGVVNNEGLGRRSSKRCCIFHKQRAFGESSTESSEDQSGDDDASSSSSGGGGSGKARRPMARKKDKKKNSGISSKPKIPDHQRYHA
jgi:protein phosphatase 1 regulatory subunit 11